jgi:hypothetical protein
MQRLLNASTTTQGQWSSRQSVIQPALTLYARELSQTLISRLADSTTLSQKLDRTFPSRQCNISEPDLRANLAELEAKRKGLMAVGLLNQNPNETVLIANRIDASTKAVLSLSTIPGKSWQSLMTSPQK